MSDEEQLDAQTEQPVVEKEPATDANPVAESSPASEDNHDKQSEGVQNRINKLTAKRYEAERRADAAEARASALETQQQAPQAPAEVASAPKLPDDIYDAEAMQAYHTDMLAYSTASAESAVNKRFTANQQAAQEQTQNVAREKVTSSYIENAVRDGVDMDKLKVVEQALNQANISAELGGHIMRDTNGAKIAEYLYDNPAVMHEILALDPVSAGIKIANEIKPQVLKTTPKVSSAPDPIPEVAGGGIVERDDFERANPGTTFI